VALAILQALGALTEAQLAQMLRLGRKSSLTNYASSKWVSADGVCVE